MAQSASSALRAVSQDPPWTGSSPQSEEPSKENERRMPLPSIPIPSSGRLQQAPASPVRINVRNQEYFPGPSSAKIEESYQPQHVREDSEGSAQRGRIGLRQEAQSSPATRMQATPRQEYAAHTAYQASKSQAAEISTGSTISMVGGPPPVPQNDLSASMSAVNLENERPQTPEAVPRLQYHHQQTHSDASIFPRFNADPVHPNDAGYVHNSNIEQGVQINRNLTTLSANGRSSVIPRPNSSFSEYGPRGRSPGQMANSPGWQGNRASSAHSGRSPDPRPVSYIDLLNTSYPQAAPLPISFDNSQLRTNVGSNASLLTAQKTLEMYRLNVKKTSDPSIQYTFAIFLIAAAQEAGLHNEIPSPKRKASPKLTGNDRDSSPMDDTPTSGSELLKEARLILAKLASASYPFAQYYLADGYASGLFSKGKEDYGTAFPLFVAASKHGHAESGYRAALCYEFGWGCRKDAAKAVQFYRQSASKNHPGAMTRLGRACLTDDLGLHTRREGLKWLRRATESADVQYNAAPYHLGILYETGYGDDIFQDETYTAQLFTQAADLGHVEASYRLGDAYEHGKLTCPRDPALSVHFYTGAAQHGHPAAMMALCAWYMVGAEPVMEKDENEAYEWAKRAAECGLTKAEYAVGYFTEMGIGCRRDPLEANMWYVRAAEAGDDRAKHRLAAIRLAMSGGDPMEVAMPKSKDLLPRGKKASGKEGLSIGGDLVGGVTGVASKKETKLKRSPLAMGNGNGSSVDAGDRAEGGSGGGKDEKDCVVM